MRRLILGILLILMMFGHNFVLNQTQSLQKPLENIHDISVTQFNLLYSLPSAISILFIVPMGFFYAKVATKLLFTGALLLSLGQLLVAIFGGQGKEWYFQSLMVGRVLEGVGAEILYMIQGNMASSWMGKYAGIIFILPQCGQIANVFVTPWAYTSFSVDTAFFIGFLTCLVSSIACLFLYLGLRTSHALKSASDEAINQKDGKHAISIEMHEQGKSDDINSPQRPPKQETTEHEHQQLQEPQQQIQQIRSVQNSEEVVPKSIFQAGKMTWLVLLLCGINECLYFPFLDNANELVTTRFCIPYEHTGYYLSIPFLSAMFASAASSFIIPHFSRHKLIFWVSLLPLIGHSIIYLDVNCEEQPTLQEEALLVLGMTFFGVGIGTYYSISFPAVGLSVPYTIRGMAYACMAFFQTLAMSLIPIAAGLIIESEDGIHTLSEGYQEQSKLFVLICLAGVAVSLAIAYFGNQNSFKYNDEEDLEQEEGKQLLKDSSARSHQTQV